MLERLGPEGIYGVAWFNKGRSYTTQVAVVDGEGHKRYKKRRRFVGRPRFEWVAVPVPLGAAPPAPRGLVEAAREAVKDNHAPSTAGYRFWELSGGGILRCAICGGRMAPHSFEKLSGKRYYYRCVKRWQHGTCEHGKNHGANDLEAQVWNSVRALLSDPEELRADLDRMIEMKRNALRMNGARREMDTWLEKLAEADQKAARFQHAYAEAAITLDDLKARLAEVGELRETAHREPERLRHHEEEIAGLERDRDALLAHYEGMAPGVLDALTPQERRNFYALLRLEVLSRPDGSLELRGAAFPEGLMSVCETGTLHPSRAGPSWSAARRVTSACCRA